MNWARMLAYITGTVDQELLLRNEYLAAENRILRAQIKGRLLLSDGEKATLAAVSYTHLDVYKRQRSCSRYLRWIRKPASSIVTLRPICSIHS